MAKDIILWCIEAPQSNFLKEVRTHAAGQRLVFTDRWDDGAMKFATQQQAERFQVNHGLSWLNVTEHMIMG